MISKARTIFPRRSRTGVFLRVTFAACWVLLAGEVYLRVFAPQPLMPRDISESEFGTRINKPNSQYRQRSAEVDVTVRINSQGIRADEDIPLDKPPGVKRIVVLGDSYGMGYEVDLKDAFATRMADDLNAAGEHVQIVNLSVSGYGTAEELLMLQNRGFAFHPDLVLLAWHHTDLDDNVNSNLFTLTDGRLARKNAKYLPGLQTRKRLERIPGYVWIEQHSQLYTFIREQTAGKVQDLLARKNPKDTQRPTTRPGDPPTYRDRLAAALLEQIQNDCRAHGIRLLILDVPTRVSRTEFYSEFPWKAASSPEAFDVVCPLDEFRSRYRGEKLFWEHGYFHFTTLACRVVGRMLADHILQQNLLTGSPAAH